MPSTVWGREIADNYDAADGAFDPAVVAATVDVLVALARGGPVLEFAVGTGRIALPLAARGVAVGQISSSHHWWTVDGRLVHTVGTFRYVFASELDLMARTAGLRVSERWGGWDRLPFSATSSNLVAVYETTG